jgi:hypothetical protein
MPDLLTATQDAFFAALVAGMGDTFGQVVQHVLEDAPLPLTVVGRIDAEDFDGKQSGLEQHTVEVVYTYRGTKRRQLYEMANAGRAALEGAPLAADGALFGRAAWQRTETDIAEDGVTYQAVQTFTVIVQPAD